MIQGEFVDSRDRSHLCDLAKNLCADHAGAEESAVINKRSQKPSEAFCASLGKQENISSGFVHGKSYSCDLVG